MSLLTTPRTFEKFNPATGATATRTAYSAAEVVQLEFDGWRAVPSATKPSASADTDAPPAQTRPAGRSAAQNAAAHNKP